MLSIMGLDRRPQERNELEKMTEKSVVLSKHI